MHGCICIPKLVRWYHQMFPKYVCSIASCVYVRYNLLCNFEISVVNFRSVL